MIGGMEPGDRPHTAGRRSRPMLDILPPAGALCFQIAGDTSATIKFLCHLRHKQPDWSGLARINFCAAFVNLPLL
jgi:hypothetical protein